jgi:hypothetical protein
MFVFEIIINLVKRTRSRETLKAIIIYYITNNFLFDVASTFPTLVYYNQNFKTYWLKLFRIVHIVRLTQPFELLLGFIL